MRLSLSAALLVIFLSGCSWFGGDDEEELKPLELKSFDAEVELAQVWDVRVGDDARDNARKLVPGISGGRIFAASADGIMMALEPESGRVIWRVEVEDLYSSEDRKHAFAKKSDAITGGVGAGEDIVVVGTFAGELVALNQSDGSLLWRARTTSEVVAPPVVHRDLVVAQSIDGKVAAFDTVSGERRWIYSSILPSLTLRGTTTPIVTDEFVVAGFASGRVALLDRARGIAGLERRIGVSQGKSDLERLVDVDGAMIIEGQNLYVASYQGTLTCIDLTSGRVLWAIDASSTAGLASGFGNVYLVHANGSVVAYEPTSGRVLWENNALLRRDLTTPAVLSSYILVGDLDGYVHVIAQADGRFVARRRVDRKALVAPAVVSGARAYLMTNSGRLHAFEVR